MAEEQNDIKLISRKNSGFPEWVDFEKLRSEGIGYIGKLAGKIWTDHNVHDPGITTLEVLCYALLDLGYRTNLPSKDIFARDPADKNADDNFFTPAEILTNNPLTITDFRKLLIDIPGIKNAWLEVATDQHANDPCADIQPPPPPPDDSTGVILSVHNPPSAPKEKDCCISYLNGLYHVYIDTEKNLDEEFSAVEKEKKGNYVNCLIRKVKRALMSHRNICEDFVDVKILCKWRIGVCAEIELDNDADPESVYLEIVERLRQFFSPSPRFYTLEQMLLDKKRSIDEVFAGRPYDVSESHGFIDTCELEALTLKKSIHVSDVYNVLFSIKGVRKIQRLRLMTCNNGKSFTGEWIVQIPKDNVPDFDFKCSGFEFRRDGIPVSFDFRKYDSLLAINFEHNGKILYHAPSNKLDVEIPRGTFHKALAAYSSIQNEFPRVYGIAEGGLSDNVPDFRKAQARQFKGYLLFFDHLLAGYLSQLQHIRSLFKLRLSVNKGNRINATYFSSVPGDVPDFQQLIRYKLDEDSGELAGETGFLAFPVSKKYFQQLADQERLKTVQIESLPYYTFKSATEKSIAISQLQDDMLNGTLQIGYVTKNDDCVYYYVLSSSEDFVLISKKYYKDEKAANVAAASILYAGSINSNYRSTLAHGDGYTFRIDLSITGYAAFLQQLTENNSLYVKRRQGFLNHLLARFSETFTDFALLSYGLYPAEELENQDIRAKAFYLSNYSLLSSTRGKAFDYTKDDWHSENNSGFEKKIRGLLGHDELKRKTLCNFEVYDYGEKYVFHLKLSEGLIIKTNEKFNTQDEARNAAHELYKSLSHSENFYTGKISYQENARLLINYGHNKEAFFNTVYSTEQDAKNAAAYIHNMVTSPASLGKVEVESYLYKAVILDKEDQPVKRAAITYQSEDEARSAAIKSINDLKHWNVSEQETGKLLINASNKANIRVIDEHRFKVDINNDMIGKPDLFNYQFLDREHRFMFTSAEEFKDPEKARDACSHAISLLSDIVNLDIEQYKDEKSYRVIITEDNKTIARSSAIGHSKSEAAQLKNDIWGIIAPIVCTLKIDAVPDTWKFSYALGHQPGKMVFVEGSQIYRTEKDAAAALQDFTYTLDKSQIEKKGKEWHLVYKTEKEKDKIILGRLAVSDAHDLEFAQHWLDAQKEIFAINRSEHEGETFSRYVEVHEDNQCRFVYHLADKDGLYAAYKKLYQTKADTKTGLANELIKSADEYDFLELQMYGNTSEYIDPVTKNKWYHYQLKSSGYIQQPQGSGRKRLVLFESIHGYPTKEEAGKAFEKYFMEILEMAADMNNYGDGKPISDVRVLKWGKDDCINKDLLAYIPKETLDFLGAYPEKAIGELINIVLRYPIKTIRKETQKDEFIKLFSPCSEFENGIDKKCKEYSLQTTNGCSFKNESPVYYFSLYNKNTKAFENKTRQPEDWISTRYYDGHEEALKAFRFFILLLNYEGNYTARKDCTGKFRIYVREVLAESVNRFYDERHAWGKEGVQKFIQVSQTPYSFHAYTDEKCCYRFFVACKHTHVVHPCQYDSPQIRDGIIKRLQHHLPAIQNWSFDYCNKNWEQVLNDFEGKGVCKIHVKEGNWQPPDRLKGYLELTSLIGNHQLCIIEKENLIRLDNNAGLVLDFVLVAGSYIQTLKDLKEKLQWLACYFPFSKKEANKKTSYCIEIRLPGFNTCDRCSDDEEESCPIAWMSECCYENCENLIAAYDKIISWLHNFSFYKPVFDCPCGQYGIELFDDRKECIGYATQKGEPAISLTSIIAKSPQCYPSAEMVCEAIRRAKKLINSEGLHFIEHILLRPHCEEDCKCVIKPCDERNNPFTKCEFPDWVVENDDPCDQTKPVCFAPGSDPYSFLATIALPAWPERFRKPENRIIVENMLHREAPAHVALRVLWLTPHDLCCFEGYYRQWLIWVAYKNSRTDEFEPCDFVDFLFNREYECWKNIRHCKQCDDEINDQPGCVELIKQIEKDAAKNNCPETWSEQLTELYCWKGMNCNEDFYLKCDEAQHEKPELEIIEDVHTERLPAVPEMPAIKKTVDQFLNSRRTKRKKEVELIVRGSGEHELAIRTNRFIGSGNPSAAAFNKLISELTTTPDKKKAKESKQDISMKRELIRSAVHFYLDKKVFGKEEPDFRDVKTSFEAIAKKGLDLNEIYQSWDPEAIKEYLEKDRFKKAEKLFKK